ncbi:MAG: YfhO family protein [Bacteroidales bacterium]
MNKYKQYLPHALVILAFAVLAYLFTPQIFQGKVVNQSDIASWRGMANEIIQYNEANPDKDPTLWTNSMFSGMPATSISVKYEGDYTNYLYNLLFVGQRPPSYLLICLVGAFLMFLAFGVNVYIAAIGAIAVTFCSYNFQIIQVGHNSKMVAIAFMPWVIAAVTYAYRKKPMLGALLFALALSFQIKANHPQITYYLAIIILGYGFAQLYMSIKEKYFPKFLRTSVYLLLAGVLGISTNINHLWPTYEYSKYTMRGGSELKGDKNQESNKKQNGLDIAYATNWSYSPQEMPNLMIPNYNGGSSPGELSTSSNTYKVLKDAGYQGAEQAVKQMPLYWGPQPFTAGPMYMGAISFFLFILGLVLLKGPVKWWIAIVSLIAVFLSWGSHLLFFTELFFKYAPLYNKFRTVSMILVILQITIPLLAFITTDKLLKGEFDKKRVKQGFIISLALTAGFALIVAIIPSLAGSFSGAADGQLPEQLKSSLVLDRIYLLRADAFRSIAYILLTAAALWFTIAKKLKPSYLYVVLGLLVLTDLWNVDKRYLNDSHFVRNREFTNQYSKRPVDEIILKDTDPNYRVLDLSINTFNDSHVSYHHKTIGGYSPVKMQRYQDMIDYHIMPEMQQIGKDINGCQTLDEVQAKLGNYPVLNMLNTKYIIVGGENPPVINNRAMENAWFVNNVKWAKDANEEISMLGSIDVRNTAIVSEDFAKVVEGVNFAETSSSSVLSDSSFVAGSTATGTITLTAYAPNKLHYKYSTDKEKIAVFSEVYYPAGWKATIDGQPAKIFRANYILRALKLPAGSHEIEFYFQPDSFKKGTLYSKVSSGLLLLLLFAGMGFEVSKLKRDKKSTF